MAMNYTIKQKNRPDMKIAGGRITVDEYDAVAKLAAMSQMTVPKYVGHLIHLAIANGTTFATVVHTVKPAE